MSRAVRAVLSRLSVAVALVLLAPPECAVGGNSDSAESSGDRVLEEILSTWKAKANSIQTLRIRARFFRRGPTDLRSLTPDQVAELVRRHEALGDPAEQFKALVQDLRTESAGERPLWVEAEYATDGQRTSEKWGSQVRVSDGRIDILAERDHRQVSIYDEGTSRYGRLWLGDFCWELEPRNYSRRGLELLEHDATAARLGYRDGQDEIEVLVDRSAKIARRVSTSGEGVVRTQVFQLGTLHCPDGLILPEISFHVSYLEGSVYSAEAISPIEVNVNGTLPDSAFTVSAPAGSRLVDARLGRPTVRTLQQDARDVFNLVSEVPNASARSGDLRFRAYVVAVSALLIVVLAIVLCLRRIRAART